MAERRSLYRKAAVSADLMALRDEHGGDALAFFLLLIPFTDRYGCVPDEPVTLKALICPAWEDVTRAQVGEWVEWMVGRRLLKRVTGPDGDRGLQLTGFQKHQGEARLDRERRSPFEPDGWLDDPSEKARRARAASMRDHRAKDAHTQGTPGPQLDHSGHILDHSDIREGKSREEKRREEPPTPFLMGGERLENGRRTGGPEDGAWAVVARAAAMDREEADGEHDTE